VAIGLLCADGLVKEAPVDLVAATPSTPGRFLVVFGGPVAEVDYALRRGRSMAGGHLVDELRLDTVEEQVFPALRGTRVPARADALAVLETRSAVSALLAADTAAKAARVHVVQIVVSRGLHGKGFVTLSGPLGDVTEGVNGAEAKLRDRGGLFAKSVIASPDPVVAQRVYAGEWGLLEGRPLY
jgi:microcompartment protein CcmL/EutN